MALDNKPEQSPKGGEALEQITTIWSSLADPLHCVMRYGPALNSYFAALIPDRHDAEEAIQEFLLRFSDEGFANADASTGRFRDYLKKCARNAALSYWRKESKRRKREFPLEYAQTLRELSIPSDSEALEDDTWVAEWRTCVLERAWQALERREMNNPSGGMPLMILRLIVDHPREDSTALAKRAETLVGKPVQLDALRQRIHRARKVLAQLVVREVAETLKTPSALLVEEELNDLRLMPYIGRYLPKDWRTLRLPPA